MKPFRRRVYDQRPDPFVAARLARSGASLQARLADPGGERRSAALAEIKRRAGGQESPVPAVVPALVGVGARTREAQPEGEPPADPEEPPRRAPRRSTPRRPRWYLLTAIGVDILAAGLPTLLLLHAADQRAAALCALIAAAAWILVCAVRGRYARYALGEISSPRPVFYDWATLLGVLAILHAFTDATTDPYVALLALTPTPVLSATVRRSLHRHLSDRRRRASGVRRVLVVGEPVTADHVINLLSRHTDHEYVVVGLCAVGAGEPLIGLPIAARLDEAPPAGTADAGQVRSAARFHRADLIVAIPGGAMVGERLSRLIWGVHDSGLSLAVLPGLAEVAQHRVRSSEAGGLMMLHIAPPIRRGVELQTKYLMDRFGAATLLMLLAPVMGVIALAVRFDSPGPVFHRQMRVGLQGQAFHTWKFRTMVADAEARKRALLSENEHDGPLFKMRRDPRVTRVGRFLRRYSLDELPLLINVLRGQMSLVGPRPPLPDEVALYDETERRRLAVRPGVTGIWQISGRWDLSWDETVRLDLRYVENWSLIGDIAIMARTFRAVIDGRGAY
ncbi:sugar transferase [Streptomyces sp. 8N616]|uniref:sugar transferase n=1 Tax=Streptomyces sp. 8N616 TaxID=3457414 RepID=UPI003FD45E62